MLKAENVMEHIKNDFEMATVDLESLNSFFCETRDMLNKIKIGFENDTAFKISKMLDEIYTVEETSKINEYIEELYERDVFENYKLRDIIEITYKEDENLIVYVMKKQFRESGFDPKKARRKMFTIHNQDTIFTRSILSNVIITFEKFLASSYESLVVLEPQKYFENKTVAISKLINEDLIDVINDVVKQEVESNMFDSLKTLDRIKDKSKIDVDRYIPIRDDFEEIYYRRNAYVHTNGCVNKIYLEKVNDRFIKDKKVGDKFVCDDEYLENAILMVNKIIASLHFELLKHNSAKSEDFNQLINFAFEVLKNNNYILAEAIYAILRKEKSFEYAHKAVFEVNYMLALKNQGKDISKLLEKFDVSMAAYDYVIAKKCLEEDYELAYKLLSREYKNYFDAEAIREWPIFAGFRNTEFYNKLIEENKEDFEKNLFKNDVSSVECCDPDSDKENFESDLVRV